jgi:anti-sigma factor RsiW
MRKKIEEELAKLAFGDLSADDAARLELQTQADPEAAETYQTYRRMKDELKMLCQEVPEDQLSKERLRQAILTRGLKHSEPVAQRATWLWMPVAAAVIAFGAFYMKGRLPLSSPETAVVFNGTVSESPDFNSAFKVANPNPSESVSKPDTARAPVVSSKPSTRVAMGGSPRASRSNSSVSLPTENLPLSGSSELEGAAGMVSFDRAPTGGAESIEEPLNFGSTASAPTVSAPEPAPKIIVIQSETDASTGALKATEVGDTANVLVGG